MVETRFQSCFMYLQLPLFLGHSLFNCFFTGLRGYSRYIHTFMWKWKINIKQVNQLSLLAKLMRFLWLKQSNYYNAFQLDSQETQVGFFLMKGLNFLSNNSKLNFAATCKMIPTWHKMHSTADFSVFSTMRKRDYILGWGEAKWRWGEKGNVTVNGVKSVACTDIQVTLPNWGYSYN